MPKFKVLSLVEHNEIQYSPEPPAGAPDPPPRAPGFGSGKAVPVDASGIIELSDQEAKPLLAGRAIEPVKEVKQSKVEKSKG